MIAVVQRVRHASVAVDERQVGSIGKGLLVLLGVEKGDVQSDLDYIVNKTAGLRIFSENGKMTNSVVDVGGEIIVVSQFTLSGDVRKGKRPDFSRAAGAAHAKDMFDLCVAAFREMGIKTQMGEFGAHMHVNTCGDGPVTILLHSNKTF